MAGRSVRGVLAPLAVVLAVVMSPLGQGDARGQPPSPAPAPPDEAGVAPGVQPVDPRGAEAFASPEVAELQRLASDVQRELADLQGRVRTAQTELDAARIRLADTRAARERADAAVTAQRQEIDAYVSALFTDLGQPSILRVLLTAGDQDDFLDGLELADALRADQEIRLRRALVYQRAAVAAERAAADAEREIAARTGELDQAASGAHSRATGVSVDLNAALGKVNRAVIAAQEEQRRRNDQTAANWRAYTDQLAAAGITPPPAVQLRDPATFPAGLRALPGADGRPQPGVAETVLPDRRRLLVLPAETIHAVNLAVEALGKPFSPGTGPASIGPTSYSCGGLISSVLGRAGLPLPNVPSEQMALLAPVAPADAQPGDVVFLGPAEQGVQHVGLVLDRGIILAADARVTSVAVTDLDPAAVLGVARPALGTRPPAPVPQRTSTGLERSCNGVILPPNAWGGARGAWGGYPNGLIPAAALCAIGSGSHGLRCDAAQAFQAMAAAYASSFGTPMCITSSYRPYGAQVALYAQKPGLAAVPGTSMHGWGLAVDLCGGIESFSTPQYAWMVVNAPSFGWVHPRWADPGMGREEPWHWEFAG